MEQWWRLVGVLELYLKFNPASVERLHLSLSLVHGDLVVEHQVQELLDPRADPLDLALASRQAGAAFHPEPVHLASELVTELYKELLVQELLLQCLEHARFALIPPDGELVVAASLITRAEAAETMLAGHDEACAADTALR